MVSPMLATVPDAQRQKKRSKVSMAHSGHIFVGIVRASGIGEQLAEKTLK